ncbi:hypothetical protein ACWEOI_33785 [Nocardia sp. NPDC004340]
MSRQSLTLLATGWNSDGQCDVAAWRDVVAIAAGWRRTLGVLADGTVLAAGRAAEGACGATRVWRVHRIRAGPEPLLQPRVSGACWGGSGLAQ